MGGPRAMRYEMASRVTAMGTLLAVLLAVGGCSWVRDVTGWGSEEEEAKRPQPPGLNQPYPNLATVPNKTPSTGTTRERLQIEEGLLADRQNARHVSGPVAGQDRPSALPPEPPARTMIVDPSARRAPAPGEPRTATAPASAPRPGPGSSVCSLPRRRVSAGLPGGSAAEPGR